MHACMHVTMRSCYHGGRAPSNVDKLELIPCRPKCEGHGFMLVDPQPIHPEATLFLLDVDT